MGFLLNSAWYRVIVVVAVLAFGGALVSKELDSSWERKEREFTRELDFGVEFGKRVNFWRWEWETQRN